MALVKRNAIWWIDITHQGKRIRQSTGTEIKSKAQQFHDKFRFELWSTKALNSLPQKSWMDAVLRWLEESTHKRTLVDDRTHLRWADNYLQKFQLSRINQDHIEHLAQQRESTGVSPATVNRMLEIIRAILRKAHKEWGWLHTVPSIRIRKIDNKRIRWLTYKEASNLLTESSLDDYPTSANETYCLQYCVYDCSHAASVKRLHARNRQVYYRVWSMCFLLR